MQKSVISILKTARATPCLDRLQSSKSADMLVTVATGGGDADNYRALLILLW